MTNVTDFPLARVPSMGSCRWPQIAAPVAAFLAVPRTWPEIDAWAGKGHLAGERVRQALAWLEEHGRAKAHRRYSDGAVVWRRVGCAEGDL